MAKKRRKKNARGFRASLRAFARQATRFCLRVFPLLILLVGLGALFVGMREALYADSNLAVQKIVVRPTQALSIARLQDLESRFLGKNILKVNLRNLARELEKDPQIQRAEISRALPSLLKIEILRRKPVAVIRFSNKGHFGLVSGDGMILDVLDAKEDSMVLLEAFELGLKEPRVGETVKNRAFQESIRFLKAFRGSPLGKREPLSRIGFDGAGNVHILFASGPPKIFLGRRPSERMAALDKVAPLLEREGRERIDYVDLEFDQVIVKRKR